jgi:hypothetical protein
MAPATNRTGSSRRRRRSPVPELLKEPVALDVGEVGFCEVAGIRVAVVAIALLAHRSEKLLTGSCSVGSEHPAGGGLPGHARGPQSGRGGDEGQGTRRVRASERDADS